MAELKLLRDTTLLTVINKDSTLTNGSRAAGLLNNATELDFDACFYLQVQYDGGPPSVGDAIANLYILPGDGEGTEVFPYGGDGTVGSDGDPQVGLLKWVFVSAAPSLSVNEVLGSPPLRLVGDGNRIVIKNVSGQTFDSTWELRAKPEKGQQV